MTKLNFAKLQHAFRTANIALIFESVLRGALTVADHLMLLDLASADVTLLHDVDNNVAETEWLAFEACTLVVNRLCARKNLDLVFDPEGLIARFVGMNFRAMALSLQAEFGFHLSDEELAHYIALEKRLVMANFLAKGVKPVAGSVDVIIAAHACGVSQRVVSSSARKRIHSTIGPLGLLHIFSDDLITSGAELEFSKPHPMPYLTAMSLCGSDTRIFVATEDALAGARSAVSAGVTYVIGTTGATPVEKRAANEQILRDAGAKAVIDHWKLLPGVMHDLVFGAAA